MENAWSKVDSLERRHIVHLAPAKELILLMSKRVKMGCKRLRRDTLELPEWQLASIFTYSTKLQNANRLGVRSNRVYEDEECNVKRWSCANEIE